MLFHKFSDLSILLSQFHTFQVVMGLQSMIVHIIKVGDLEHSFATSGPNTCDLVGPRMWDDA